MAEGFRRRTLASNLGPPQSPTTWTMQDQVPFAPKYSQATPRQKYIHVKFPINCHVARWPRALGDGHRPQIWDLPKVPPRGRRGIESRSRRNTHRLPRRKSTYRSINCVARWPSFLGDGHWPQISNRSRKKWLLLNNHTPLGRLGSAALVGSQSR